MPIQSRGQDIVTSLNEPHCVFENDYKFRKEYMAEAKRFDKRFVDVPIPMVDVPVENTYWGCSTAKLPTVARIVAETKR